MMSILCELLINVFISFILTRKSPISKAWFPYDHLDCPNHPSRLKIGPSDWDDHMETQQR